MKSSGTFIRHGVSKGEAGFMQVERAIRDYLTQNVLYTEEGVSYSDDTSLLDAGILDSMAVMELVTWTGSTFGFQVDVRDMTADNFDSVNRLARYIRSKTAAREAAEIPDHAGAVAR